MFRLIDRGCLYAGCFAILLFAGRDNNIVIAALVLFLMTCLGYIFEEKRFVAVLIMIYCLYGKMNPYVYAGIPILVYELLKCIVLAYQKKRISDWSMSIVASGLILYLMHESLRIYSPMIHAAVVVLSIIAVLIGIYSEIYYDLKQRLIVERDNSQELNLALKENNRYLIEKQDADIHLATLKERNRIAREIHDNVGHMLSRSILLTGAALAVSKDESLKPMLEGLKSTLDGAMSSIRTSVHDLHDESIDLDHAVSEILEQLQDYRVNYEYDMSSKVPRNIKYCFITVVKEATANIIKHSNADQVDVILREHPSFYQLQVKDNGVCIHEGDGTGIGIENMKERIDAFHGTIHITTDHGYRIFINIPKGQEETDESSNN